LTDASPFLHLSRNLFYISSAIATAEHAIDANATATATATATGGTSTVLAIVPDAVFTDTFSPLPFEILNLKNV